MKSLKEIILESSGWEPDIMKTHRDAYNSFIKWYDKQLKYMNKDELLDMLKCICQDIQDDSLEPLK